MPLSSLCAYFMTVCVQVHSHPRGGPSQASRPARVIIMQCPSRWVQWAIYVCLGLFQSQPSSSPGRHDQSSVACGDQTSRFLHLIKIVLHSVMV